ncbi:MAG TPA: twin-arginine translocase subunit TatC, partial [Methylomirabilota bacterium]|nr:twin-arginine translocase subunit TatC [Methylomirabilota bacterium]
AIGMLLCLIAGNHVVGLLTYPLKKAEALLPGPSKMVSLYVGTNLWGTFKPGTNALGDLVVGTNQHMALGLVTHWTGSNHLLALEPLTNTTLVAEGARQKVALQNFGPVGGFWVAFQVAMYGGILLAAPLVIYFVGQFVIPALHRKEKYFILRGFAIGTALFLIGVAFCYFILLQWALRASVQYSEWLGFSAGQWRAEEYISFVCKFMLGMGLGFEMPVVVLTLVKLGLVTYRGLASFRRYMIVINLILGAVLTTPEVLTQVLMAIPLQILYEVSVWIAWYWERKDRKKAEAAART